jgi:hypothetical protein
LNVFLRNWPTNFHRIQEKFMNENFFHSKILRNVKFSLDTYPVGFCK